MRGPNALTGHSGEFLRLTALVLGLLVAGCGGDPPSPAPTGPSAPSSPATSEGPAATALVGAPLAAFFYLTGVPPTAPLPIEVRVAAIGDVGNGFTFDFNAGETIVAAEAVGPGLYGALVDDRACEGDMNLVAELEADAVLLISRDRCVLSVADVHPAGGGHSGSAIAGQVPMDLVGRAGVTIASLDKPRNPVPDPVELDESGHFAFPSLQEGRYRLTLLVDGVTVNVLDVALQPGIVEYVSLVGEG